MLLPTLQSRLELSVAQAGWCLQALYGAAAVVEPVAAAAVDVAARRPLLVWGALGWGLALLLVAGAPSFAWLAPALLLMGAGSGPLAQTTDVLLVEMHPGAEERIGARQTMLDTTGALLAPGAVAAAAWAGAHPGCPSWSLAARSSGTPSRSPPHLMPGPDRTAGSRGPLHRVRANAVALLGDREARLWLVALLGETLMDVPALFEPVWLAEDVGASQAIVAVHAIVQLTTALVGLALLDRWLPRHGARTILTAACVANLLAYPAWLLVPGMTGKLLLVVPVTLAVTPVWPLVRARALAAVPSRGGALMAITSLYGVLPPPALFGWSGGRVGLTPTMFVVHTAATLLVLAAARRCARTG